MPGMEGMAALVTGGGSGIGLGCARRFAADGAHVTIAGRTEARLAEAATDIAAIAAPGVTVRYVVSDVTSEPDVQRAVATAAEPTGKLDVLFACAGGSLHGGPIVASDAGVARHRRPEPGRNVPLHQARGSGDDARRWRFDRRHVVDRGSHDAPVHERVLREQGRDRDAREVRGRRAG